MFRLSDLYVIIPAHSSQVVSHLGKLQSVVCVDRKYGFHQNTTAADNSMVVVQPIIHGIIEYYVMSYPQKTIMLYLVLVSLAIPSIIMPAIYPITHGLT